jgi:hypothetical protein
MKACRGLRKSVCVPASECAQEREREKEREEERARASKRKGERKREKMFCIGELMHLVLPVVHKRLT